MDQRRLPLISLAILVVSLLLFSRHVHGNGEGTALIAFKASLINDDQSNNRLQSWNTATLDPCRYNWQHITCNSDNSVVMVVLNNFSLSGPLVPELGQLTNLQILQLSRNKITGRIPDELGNLISLRTLDLSFNELHGAIPNSLGKLWMLQHLLLNNNTLTGSVPVSLTAINTLEFIDISNNNLSGDVLLNGSFSHIPSSSFAGNPNLQVSVATHEAPTILRSRSPSVWSRTTTAIAIGTCVGVVILAVGISWWCCRKQDIFYDVPAEEDPKYQLGQLKFFTLMELEVATENFDEKLILGRGETSRVYKGRLKDGTLVAVKRLKPEPSHVGKSQFETEAVIISNAVHRNVLQLRGFCCTPTERLLVYPFMANGSVMACLRERRSTHPLNWPTRKQIALACARGLAYLHEHCNPKIIHRDVKAANILLNENFEALIGDFGLGKHMDYNATHVSTAVRGTYGHMPPEYPATGKASVKTDVFGYGMTLLELISGKSVSGLALVASAYKDYDVESVYKWVKGLWLGDKLEDLADIDLRGKYAKDEMEQLVDVALRCIQVSPSDRPKMSDVVRELEGGKVSKESWDTVKGKGKGKEKQKQESGSVEFEHVLDIIKIGNEFFNSMYDPGSSSHLSPEQLSSPR